MLKLCWSNVINSCPMGHVASFGFIFDLENKRKKSKWRWLAKTSYVVKLDQQWCVPRRLTSHDVFIDTIATNDVDQLLDSFEQNCSRFCVLLSIDHGWWFLKSRPGWSQHLWSMNQPQLVRIWCLNSDFYSSGCSGRLGNPWRFQRWQIHHFAAFPS